MGVAFFGVGAKGAQRWLKPWFYSLPAFGNYESGNASCDRMVAFEEGPAPNLKVPIHRRSNGGVPSFLILQQPDLGTSLLVASSGLAVIYMAGIQWRYILSLISLR